MSSPFPDARRLVVTLLTLAAVVGCERETRRFRELPPTATADTSLRLSPLQPGPPVRQVRYKSAYEDNAFAASEGKRLFSQFNCVGCHGHGGGAMGPPLMDDEWIYGSDPENIFATIVEGRPNGMPAFGGKISTSQVWQLVAYVRALSGLLAKDVAPTREDALYGAPQEQATHEQSPTESSRPPQSEQP
jgi:cytochrome c oxidase cbb3-type subunit 3